MIRVSCGSGTGTVTAVRSLCVLEAGTPAMKCGACPGVQEQNTGDVEAPQDVPSYCSPSALPHPETRLDKVEGIPGGHGHMAMSPQAPECPPVGVGQGSEWLLTPLWHSPCPTAGCQLSPAVPGAVSHSAPGSAPAAPPAGPCPARPLPGWPAAPHAPGPGCPAAAAGCSAWPAGTVVGG